MTDPRHAPTKATESNPTVRSRVRSARGRSSVRFRREERREFRYQLAVGTAVVSSWIIWYLPPPARRWLADRLGDAFFRLSKTYRENVIDNVGTAMGTAAPDEIRAAARRIFRLSARNFGDLLLIPRLDRRTLVRSVALAGGDWSYIEEPLAAGRGVVLLTAHIGAFDYVGHTLAMRGYRVTSVTGRTSTRFVFDAVTYLRRAHGASIVEASPSGVRRVIQGLRRGESAALLNDYDFFQNGRPVTLFGRPTTLPPGAVRIARETGAVIVGTFARRTEQGYAVTLTEPFAVDKTDDLDADLDRGLQRVVGLLEQAIAATPDQWVMFQRVWPSAPADPVRVFPVGSPLESELLERVGAVLPGPRPDPS